MTQNIDKDCACTKCVKACRQHPGWFAPGEAEKAADLLGMDFEDFKFKYLIKDHCDNQDVDEAPYVWTPRKEGIDVWENGQIRTPLNQRLPGVCVFLKDDRCSIHAAKPYECRKAFACDFKYGIRDAIEEMYRADGYPLGER